jgi:hypothetical protein|tara:strand:- start:461 stop:667 length:207 start_codon:yes stop_codon:yes gene_type:complete
MRTTKQQIREEERTTDDMRYDLAEAEAVNMNTSDIINLLVDGYEGLDNISDFEIKEEWATMFGDELKS